MFENNTQTSSPNKSLLRPALSLNGTGTSSDNLSESLSSPVLADHGIQTAVDEIAILPNQSYRSWPFRWAVGCRWFFDQILGFFSMVVIVAIGASIPIVQLISFGFLLDVSGRVARSGRLRDGFSGVNRAALVGRGLLGTFLCLLPLYLIGEFWYASFLIDPSSSTTQVLRAVQIVLAVALIGHILAAWFCGAKLRYFVWPLLAPLSLSLWTLRLTLASRWLHPVVRFFCWPFSRHLANDLAQVPRLKNWFLPAIVFDQIRHRRLWSDARDGLWAFLGEVPTWRLFQLGLVGFLGSFLWLLLPTLMMIVATSQNSPTTILMGLAGTVLSTAVFSVLLPLQTEFATSGKGRDLFRLDLFWARVRQAPIWYLLAILTTLALAIPLFLLKIEQVPPELRWTLSLLFVFTGWLSRLALGWAHGRALRAARWRHWSWSIPTVLLILPLSFSFVFILFITRYISWHGVWSLIENPVFLLPAPFWL